jgi:4-hydroxy-tetrahydrodipicolinate reductase
MYKLRLNGAKGRMGQAITAAAANAGCEISFAADMGDNPEPGMEGCDCVVDFSFRDVTPLLADLCVKYGKPLVVGTTGHSEEQRKQILECSKKIPMVWAGNYSLGVNLLNYLTKVAVETLGDDYDIEVVEMHHHFKKDAPSGTAEKLINILKDARGLSDNNVVHGRSGLVGERPKNEIGVHALRGGSVVGDHTVIFAHEGERLELTHKASDRTIFAGGALRAAKWLAGKPAGLYGMEDVLGFSK